MYVLVLLIQGGVTACKRVENEEGEEGFNSSKLSKWFPTRKECARAEAQARREKIRTESDQRKEKHETQRKHRKKKSKKSRDI